MIYYVSSTDKENIESAMRELQTRDLKNCYISPLIAFSHLDSANIDSEDVAELRFDLLTCADCLIVLDTVQEEINFAKLVKMEVMRLDKDGELRPFTE